MSHIRVRHYAFVVLVLTALLAPLWTTDRSWADSTDRATPTDGLILWLDASDGETLQLDGDLVAAWANKAPGAANRLASSESQRPRHVPRSASGARARVRFDGVDDVLRDLNFNHQASAWTLLIVAARSLPGTGGGLCSARSRSGHDYDPGFTVDLFNSTTHFDQLNVEGAGRIGGQRNQKQTSDPLGPLHVIVVERDDTVIRLFVNGRPEGRRPVNPATTVMDEIRVGSRYYASRERAYLPGDVAEVLLYDRVLTPAERQGLELSRAVSAAERKAAVESMAQETAARERNRMRPPTLVKRWSSIAAYGAATSPQPPLEDLPFRTDIRHAIRQCVSALNNSFDRDKDDEPYFFGNRRDDGYGEFHHSVNIGIPHVVGRGLWGSMLAEETANVSFPGDALSIYTRYAKLSFDSDDHLNGFNDPDRDNKRFIAFHNMREGLLGLVALMRGRHDAWAKEQGHRMLITLEKLTDASGHLSMRRARRAGIGERCEGIGNDATTSGRVVGPLVEYYEFAKDPRAMKLADRYARATLKSAFTAEGRFARMKASGGHIHSITSSLSGIARYAQFTDDQAMLETCRRIVDNGVPEWFSSWGWGDEVMPEHPANVVGRGEINQTGDVIRTALILGQSVDPKYYEMAERFLRSMLLPTQHDEEEMRRYLKDRPAPRGDFERDVLRRVVGGYAMQLPNDRMREGDWPLSTLDITSGAVHALCECWRHRVTVDKQAIRLNLLFDYDGEEVEITSGLPMKGEIAFRAKNSKMLLIRVPEWVAHETIRWAIGDKRQDPEIQSGYLKITNLQPGDTGRVTFDVPVTVQTETVDGAQYTTTWAGNQIVDILPRGKVSPLPF